MQYCDDLRPKSHQSKHHKEVNSHFVYTFLFLRLGYLSVQISLAPLSPLYIFCFQILYAVWKFVIPDAKDFFLLKFYEMFTDKRLSLHGEKSSYGSLTSELPIVALI